jgi:hypothetical protein
MEYRVILLALEYSLDYNVNEAGTHGVESNLTIRA